MISRLPSGDALRIDLIDRISFRETITNEDAFRASIRFDLLSNSHTARIPPEKALVCDVLWRDGKVEAFMGKDAEAFKKWVDSLPLLGEGSSV